MDRALIGPSGYDALKFGVIHPCSLLIGHNFYERQRSVCTQAPLVDSADPIRSKKAIDKLGTNIEISLK